MSWDITSMPFYHKWATTWQNQQNECAPSDDWNQPGHLPNLIRVFAVRMKKLGSLATHRAHSEDTVQTGWMPRLIWVFAGRTIILLVLSCRSSFPGQHEKYQHLVTLPKNSTSPQTRCIWSFIQLLKVEIYSMLVLSSQKHLRAEKTPNLHLKYSKNGGNLG